VWEELWARIRNRAGFLGSAQRRSSVKAAVKRGVGALAEVDDVAEPVEETIEVLAASINPIDLAVSRGVLATGHPELPYVPGCEALRARRILAARVIS
jgi:hypothetical protein